MAGRRAADVYPSLEVAYPTLTFEAFDPAKVAGLDVGAFADHQLLLDTLSRPAT